MVQSRSRKTIGVNVHTATPRGFAVAQVGLGSDEVDELRHFLHADPALGDSASVPFEVRDPESKSGRVLAAWNSQGNRLALTLVPTTPWEGDVPTVVLTADQVTALADFLSLITGPKPTRR
jgi:hypothetical protein